MQPTNLDRNNIMEAFEATPFTEITEDEAAGLKEELGASPSPYKGSEKEVTPPIPEDDDLSSKPGFATPFTEKKKSTSKKKKNVKS